MITVKKKRSLNWEEEEKQLLREIMKDYSEIIENKSMNTNMQRAKMKAWIELHSKFNGLNAHPRELIQLQAQWKGMKVMARKSHANFRREAAKTGGGPRPPSPSDETQAIIDLLNPNELTIDVNMYDSDAPMTEDKTCLVIEDDVVDLQCSANKNYEIPDDKPNPIKRNTANHNSELPADKPNTINRNAAKKVKKHPNPDYITEMTEHSRKIKDEEHQKRMSIMALEEIQHKLKVLQEEERLKLLQLERQIMQKKLTQLK